MRSLPATSASRIAATRRPGRLSIRRGAAFYVNSPFGIVLGHNGNLTNAERLKDEMFPHRPAAHQHRLGLGGAGQRARLRAREGLGQAAPRSAAIFTAVANVHRRVRGAYAVVAMIAGYGVLAFRDPFGIRPR